MFKYKALRLPCSRQASQATHTVSGIWDQAAPCSMGPGGGQSMGPNPWRRVPGY
jgi:hypothetical protein